MIAFSLLLFGGLYLLFCLWLSNRLAANVSHNKRTGVKFCLVLGLLLVPVIDGILGNVVTRRMCSAHSATEILGQTTVPTTALQASLMSTSGSRVDWKALSPYVLDTSKEQLAGVWPRVRQVTHLLRTRDGKELARTTDFHYAGGWLPVGSSGRGVGALSCYSEPSFESLLPKVLLEQVPSK
jgi:hypothetical protein